MASCTATVPDKDASGDNFYGQFICSQAYIDYFWYTYGFSGNKKFWDDGFGWHDPCNTSLPLARTFNACYALTYSAQDYLNDSWDAPQNILQWGRRYLREEVDDLESKCGDGSAIARSFTGWFVNDRVELYLGFFYTYTVVDRAADLLHEARHQDGKGHNADLPAGSVYGTGGNADSNWDYQGAWTFHAGYLWWFYAAAVRTTSAMKERARQSANVIIDNAFAEHPGFSV